MLIFFWCKSLPPCPPARRPELSKTSEHGDSLGKPRPAGFVLPSEPEVCLVKWR